ncbi:integrase, partial [Treponema phagedenis]
MQKKQLSIEEQLQGTKEQVTQFGKIIKYLGIDMFPAHSSQAKGRVERLW